MLTDAFSPAGLIHAVNRSPSEEPEEGLKESSPFGRLAMKLGLPANCDIDLRKQEELEVKSKLYAAWSRMMRMT